ncbi:WAS/WASL-interacting protein family member 1 [Drosophila eugracilis]|uniref:WAS/WASL-interacting protein family member 1 n=1 Tax=Drosophila eugracilis TaxID=29029 RepID=UPI0007E7B104|nr:WAS/WASL-interacting protein family member 1 [Drosophila eugracilis]
MTRSSPAWMAVQASLAWFLTTISIRSSLAQFAVSSPGRAVASAGGVTVVAQLPGLGVINGLINAMHNNNRFNQQQQFERLQQGRPGMGPNRRGMPRPGFGSPNRQQAPPGWPPGWQWGAGGNQNQPGFGWEQSGFGPGWNGGGQQPGWNGGGGEPGWNGGGGPGWNGGGGRGPPPRPGWNGGGPPPRPSWNGGGPPPPRPDWGGGMGPPPRPDWNGGFPPEWNNNQRFPDEPDANDPNENWNNPNNEANTTPVVPTTTTTTPKPAETHPTIQPLPPTQPTKDTLIIGTNRPPLVPPQNPDPTPTYPNWPVPQPIPNHSIELSEERAIIFPSSSKYIHAPNQEIPSQPIDVRRK